MKSSEINTKKLVEIARDLYAETSGVPRWLQICRPYICPFDCLIQHIPQGVRVLDVGCGCGLFLGLLAKTSGLHSSVGFDTSEKAIAVAKKMSNRCNTSSDEAILTFIRCRAEDPWPEGNFDVVSMIDVIHHVPPPVQESVMRTAA